VAAPASSSAANAAVTDDGDTQHLFCNLENAEESAADRRDDQQCQGANDRGSFGPSLARFAYPGTEKVCPTIA